MSSTEWEERGEAERVDPDELGAAPPGSADEVSGAEEVSGADEAGGGGWTEGGGELGPEGGSERTGAEEELP